MANVEPIPPNGPRLIPYLHVEGAAAAIDFYRDVFGATERFRMPAPGDKVGHAQLTLGDAVIMLADADPDHAAPGPKSTGGTPTTLLLYVEDVDSVFDRAIEAGSRSVMAVQNQFYGDRCGAFEDPFGHRWTVATHVEDVSEEEMAERMRRFTDS